VSAAEARGLALASVADFASVTGKGVQGTIDGCRVLIGNAALLADAKIDAQGDSPSAQSLQAEGQTVMFVAVDGPRPGSSGRRSGEGLHFRGDSRLA
jgi:Cu+-exporting ATPase